MDNEWTTSLPGVVVFIIGIGGLAAAVLYIRQLYRVVVPDGDVQMHEDIGTIKRDLHEISGSACSKSKWRRSTSQPSSSASTASRRRSTASTSS